jgi:hypothetical protein
MFGRGREVSLQCTAQRQLVEVWVQKREPTMKFDSMRLRDLLSAGEGAGPQPYVLMNRCNSSAAQHELARSIRLH